MLNSIIKYGGLLRPQQWLKNLLVLFPSFFAGNLLHDGTLGVIAPSFISFSLMASCGYILNDIRDREFDRFHHTKKNRAIVRGDVSVPFVAILAGMLYLASMFSAASISSRFEGFLILYFFLTLSYTFYFKDIPVIDIFIVAAGFLVRVFAGGVAFKVPVSNWLFLTVFIVSLFLAAGKRLGEMTALGEDAHKQRKILSSYSASFLTGVLWICASVAIVVYALYAIENKRELVYTVPIVVYGFMRYLYITKDRGNGDPTDVLLKDGQMMTIGMIWLIAVAYIIYH